MSALTLFTCMCAQKKSRKLLSYDYTVDLSLIKSSEFQYMNENTTMLITGLQDNLTMFYVGRFINFRMKSNSKFQILPDLNCTIDIMISEFTYLSIYNEFASNLLYQTKMNFIVNKPSSFHLLQSTWPLTQPFFHIQQYSHMNFIIDSDSFPFQIDKIDRNVETIVIPKKKHLYFPFPFKMGKSLKLTTYIKNYLINFTKFQQEAQRSKVEGTYFKVYIEEASLQVVNFTNIELEISILKQKGFSKLICEDALVHTMYNQALTLDNIYIDAINLILKKVVLGRIDMHNTLQYPFIRYRKSYEPSQTKWECEEFEKNSIISFNQTNENIVYVQFNRVYSVSDYVDIIITENQTKINDTKIRISSENLTNLSSVLPDVIGVLHINIESYYEETLNITINNHKNKILKIYSLANHRQNVRLLSFASICQITLINLMVNYINISSDAMLLANSSIIESNNCFYKGLNLYQNSSIISKNISATNLDIYEIQSGSYINGTNLFYDGNKIDTKKFCMIQAFVNDNHISKIYNLANIPIDFIGTFTLQCYVNSATFSFLKDENVTLLVTNPVKHLTTKCNVYTMMFYPTFNHNSSIHIIEGGKIFSDQLVEYKIKNLFLDDIKHFNNFNNIIFIPDILNVSIFKMIGRPSFSCKTLSIHSTCMAYFTSISDVEKIDIHYSIFRSGYIYADNFYTKKEGNIYKGFNVTFYNFDENDQYYYEKGIADFSVEILCSMNFNANLSDINFEFISNHWNFDGDSRNFDMEITNKTNETCISIVARKEKSTNPKNLNLTTIVIIVISLIGSILIIGAITLIALFFIKRKQRRAIDKFMSDSINMSIL